MSKKTIIKGTLILTLAGFLTRIIGFFYKIFLSKELGAETMGVYQLIFPIYGICFTLYASGIQTSISKLIAGQIGKTTQGNPKNVVKTLRLGLTCSLLIAFSLSIAVFFGADLIAQRFIAEPASAESLRIMSVVFPFCAITANINGYYYGLKKTFVPASTQLLEQMVRVAFVFLIANFYGNGDMKLTCEIAVLGLVVGEIGSTLYNIASMLIGGNPKKQVKQLKVIPEDKHILKQLIKLAVPLTSNRLLLSVLNSIEAVLIPIMLRRSGLSVSDSLSIFGVLIGMALPFIFFPTAITNAFAILLLPTISEADASNNEKQIKSTTAIAIKYCLIIGILSTGLFITFGHTLGNIVYDNEMVGTFLVTLAWLCPCLYLTTTLSSILNGLGKAHVTFLNSVVGISLRILFVVFAIPAFGINGYMIGVLISQLAITTLDVFAIKRNINIAMDWYEWLLKPGLFIAILSFFANQANTLLLAYTSLSRVWILLIASLFLIVSYLIMLILSKTVRITEFKR